MSILDELLEFKDKKLSDILVAEEFSKTIYSKLRPRTGSYIPKKPGSHLSKPPGNI